MLHTVFFLVFILVRWHVCVALQLHCQNSSWRWVFCGTVLNYYGVLQAVVIETERIMLGVGASTCWTAVSSTEIMSNYCKRESREDVRGPLLSGPAMGVCREVPVRLWCRIQGRPTWCTIDLMQKHQPSFIRAFFSIPQIPHYLKIINNCSVVSNFNLNIFIEQWFLLLCRGSTNTLKLMQS